MKTPRKQTNSHQPILSADPTDPHTPAPVAKKEKRIPVVEMFGPTIEGEGAVIGTPTMFIRFGLCDYKCTRCDSVHAVDPLMVKALAKWLTLDEIFTDMIKMKPAHIKTITFSGGNPAIHALGPLVEKFQSAGLKIVVETQGTKVPEWLRTVDHLVISPKSPGMGEQFDPKVFSTFMENALLAHNQDNWSYNQDNWSIKIVIFTNQDLEFAVGVAGELEKLAKYLPALCNWEDNFYLSLGNPFPPQFSLSVEGEVTNDGLSNKALVEELLSLYNTLSEEILKDPRLGFAKFLPQLHVLVWGNETEK